jgi:hypothetical protein
LCVKRRLSRCRLEVADLMHLLAMVVGEGIDAEVAEKGVSPAKARRVRSLRLTQQKKDGSDIPTPVRLTALPEMVAAPLITE